MNNVSPTRRRVKPFPDSTEFRISRRAPVSKSTQIRRIWEIRIDSEDLHEVFEYSDGSNCSCGARIDCRHRAALRRLGIRLRRETLYREESSRA